MRTNLNETDPVKLWAQYIQLTEVEAAFRVLKSNVGMRPIYHWTSTRIEAHIMLAVLGYAMWACLRWTLKSVASSLSPRPVIELFRRIQLVEVWFDTVDGRRICLPRITAPEPEHHVVLDQLRWTLHQQPPPRIYRHQ